MTGDLHIVLDQAVMIAAGRGNLLASRLIHRAYTEAGWFLYAPACALVEADRAHPGAAEHIAALPGVTVLGLYLPAALTIARKTTWAAARTRHAAQPTPDRPDGARSEVATGLCSQRSASSGSRAGLGSIGSAPVARVPVGEVLVPLQAVEAVTHPPRARPLIAFACWGTPRSPTESSSAPVGIPSRLAGSPRRASTMSHPTGDVAQVAFSSTHAPGWA